MKMFVVVVKLLGALIGVGFLFVAFAIHGPVEQEGVTGVLTDRGNRDIPLRSFTFLAHEGWGKGFTVPGISSLVMSIKYDTKQEGTGHVLFVHTLGQDVRVAVRHNSSVQCLRTGEEALLHNEDEIAVVEGETHHLYRYKRHAILRKELSTWVP